MNRLLIIFALLIPSFTFAQYWAMDYSIGYGTYQLSDVRNLQQSMITNYGLKITDAFPGNFTHSVSLGYIKNQTHFGTQFSYLTTGGRLQRADYSGSYTIDMILNGYSLGVFSRKYFQSTFSPLNFYLHISSGVLYSNLRVSESLVIYSDSATGSNTLKGLGVFIEPAFGATYKLTKNLLLSLGGGFEINFSGNLFFSGQQTSLKANWSGFRISGGLVFVLPVNKKL